MNVQQPDKFSCDERKKEEVEKNKSQEDKGDKIKVQTEEERP